MRSSDTSGTEVKIHAPAWDRKLTHLNENDTILMKAYFHAGNAQGIGDEAITEDLQGEFGHLGRISIKPRDQSATLDQTVWIVVEPYLN